MPLSFTNDSASIGTTEYFLASDSTTATYQTDDCALQVWLDLTNLAAGDVYQVSIYEKINGSSALVVDRWFVSANTEGDAWVMPTLLVGEGWEVGVKKISGTNRTIGWSLRKSA